MKSTYVEEFDADKFNDCMFASLSNPEVKQIVDKYINISAKYVNEHGGSEYHNKLGEILYEENGGEVTFPPSRTEVLAQFMNDMHHKLNKKGLI